MPRIKKPLLPHFRNVDTTKVLGGFKHGDKVILDIDKYRSFWGGGVSPLAPIEDKIGVVIGVNPSHQKCLVVYYPDINYVGASGHNTYTINYVVFKEV